MTTTEPLTPLHRPAAAESRRAASPRRGAPPTFGEMVDEVVPIVGVILVAGPPVIFIAGPWVLLCLMLTGPFAVLVAFAALSVIVVVLVAALAAIFATPYLLLRAHHRRHRPSQPIAVPRAHVVSLESSGVVA